MKIIQSLWNNFKTQPDIWFFYGFLATFTLSIRKVMKFYPIAGQFNEYGGIYLYLSDIFLVITLICWGVVILRNKNVSLSSISSIFGLYKPLFKILLILNAWSTTSILWSDNQVIAIFRSIKILEFSLLLTYVILRNVPRGTFYRTSAEHLPENETTQPFSCPGLRSQFRKIAAQSVDSNNLGAQHSAPVAEMFHVEHFWKNGAFIKQLLPLIILSGLIQALIGIYQFFTQQSLGLFWLKESLLSPDLPGVAKVIFSGEKYIRAYGLFPHPNILGGFLVFSLIITWVYYKMFHPSTNVPRGTFYGADARLASTSLCESRRVEHSTGQAWNSMLHKSFPFLISLQLLALLLTFSKSALIGLMIAILYILWKFNQVGKTPLRYKCSTWNILRGKRGTNCELYHYELDSESISEETLGQARNDKSNKIPSEKEYYMPATDSTNVPRGTFTRTIMFHVEHYWKEISIFVLILIIGLNYLHLDWNAFLVKSLRERQLYLTASWEIISNNPYWGIGIGQSVWNMGNNVPRGTLLEAWQYQPVHNVFILIWNELGIIGLCLFMFFLWRLFRFSANIPLTQVSSDPTTTTQPNTNVPRGTFCGADARLASTSLCESRRVEHYAERAWDQFNRVGLFSEHLFFRGIFFGFLFIMFFDHYLWDIQQGQVIFWLILAIISRQWAQLHIDKSN